jgi:hypothetical protein
LILLRSVVRPILVILLILSGLLRASGQPRTIHVLVALCDNQYQGIVPVPASLGNGQDPKSNLYWGAAYGIRSYFKNKTSDWELVRTLKTNNPRILERILFKHATRDVYILADAYDGKEIRTCITDFLRIANGQIPVDVNHNSQSLHFGGGSGLVAYIGHNGLMDFNVNVDYRSDTENKNDVMILACYSKSYFSPEIRNAGANPILWTTHLMAPEAYTLKAAIDGWIRQESGAQIDERAAQVYNRYQKCGLKGARNLFTTGF